VVGAVLAVSVDPIAAAAHIARLAAERSLSVAEVEKRAGTRPGFLSPVDVSKLRATGIADVADVLGVQAGDIVDDSA
jgi:hypothetical protein